MANETWYKIIRTVAKIEPVEVIRSTHHKVWLAPDSYYRKERAKNRVTSHDSYFPNWEQAHAALLAEAELSLNYARVTLQRMQGHHGNVVGLTPSAELKSE